MTPHRTVANTQETQLTPQNAGKNLLGLPAKDPTVAKNVYLPNRKPM
jgi:hypothetical protein